MNPNPATGLPSAIDAALRRVKQAARGTIQRSVDGLGVSALASASNAHRDALLGAQFELNRKLALFCATFDDALDERVGREVRTHAGSERAATDWNALSLVDDREVELQVSAERFGMQIARDCEAPERELDAVLCPLLRALGAEAPRNPLRPEVIGDAVLRSIERITDSGDQREALAAELARGLAVAMPPLYAAIVSDLRAAGLKPALQGLRNPDRSFARSGSGFDTASRPSGFETPGHSSLHGAHTGVGGYSNHGSFGNSGGATGGGGGGGGAPGRASGHASGRGGLRQAPPVGGTPLGQVDVRVMALIRELADVELGEADLAALARATAPAAFGVGPDHATMIAPNLIHAHRDALRRVATGTLDHMVIDVIGSLFDQILSDPKVPPQMARQIARLQLPVLRAALGDPSFFSSRKHPVRRFVNRIASLGSAFDDLDTESGRRFVTLVRELVQQVVEGDFEQIELYETKLAALEAFAVEQARNDVQDGAAALLAERETDLRLQQRYARQLDTLLQPLPMHDFVRDFIAQVWSQAMMRAARLDGADSPRARRMRHAARELIMSVQPKGSPEQRKAFLLALPTLMKELNEGLELIGWADPARKGFFGKLLPAHAESLKGQTLRTLDYNLLVRQVDAAIGEAMPSAGELPPPPAHGSVLRDDAIVPRFSAEEAQRIGLVDETAVDWDGKVDIEIGAEPEVAEADLQIDGLPKADAPEPTHGKSLADHVQIGFAYQMHLDGKWQKVRLAHVSPGRAFFAFTVGSRHPRTISMTHRMLVRLCDAGRLRAFENAYLIERATARARRQLAAIGAHA